jgi:hypothetical protein
MACAPYQLAADRSQSGSIASVLGIVAAVLYGVSFFLPASKGLLGFQAFFFSVLMVFTIPMWLANPLFWLGLALLSGRQWQAARFYGLLALVLGLSESWMFWEELSTGYFLWVGSMALLAAAGWCGCRMSQASRGAFEGKLVARAGIADRDQPW